MSWAWIWEHVTLGCAFFWEKDYTALTCFANQTPRFQSVSGAIMTGYAGMWLTMKLNSWRLKSMYGGANIHGPW